MTRDVCLRAKERLGKVRVAYTVVLGGKLENVTKCVFISENK